MSVWCPGGVRDSVGGTPAGSPKVALACGQCNPGATFAAMSSYTWGDRLRNPATGATFEVIGWLDGVVLRNERTGNPTIVSAAVIDRFERVESR